MSETLARDPSGKIEFRLLTDDKLEQVFALQQETMREECLAIGVGMWDEPGAAEEMLLIFQQVIKDGISIIALDTESNQVAAVAFNKLHKPLENREQDELSLFIDRKIRHQACLELVRFLDQVETKVDIFKRYKVKGALELFYIGTSPKYQGRGLATQIVTVTLQLARNLVSSPHRKSGPTTGTTCTPAPYQRSIVIPEIVFGVFASKYSQRIAAKLGFEVLAQIPYAEYNSGGRKMSERIGQQHEKAVFALSTL